MFVLSKYPPMPSSMVSVDNMCPSTMFPLKKLAGHRCLSYSLHTNHTSPGEVGMCMWSPVGPSAILTPAWRVSTMDERDSRHRYICWVLFFMVGLPLMLRVGRKEAEDRTLNGQNGEVVK